MKTIKWNKLLIAGVVLVSGFLSSCEEETETPVMQDVRFFVRNVEGEDSLVNVLPAFERFKIVVTAASDKAAIWYGGDCNVVKSSTGGDTTDVWGNPIIDNDGSDCYEHYGLLYAEGEDLSPGEEEGISTWVDDYSYRYKVDTDGASSGELIEETYTATIILTNDGFDGPDFKQRVENVSVNVQYTMP